MGLDTLPESKKKIMVVVLTLDISLSSIFLPAALRSIPRSETELGCIVGTMAFPSYTVQHQETTSKTTRMATFESENPKTKPIAILESADKGKSALTEGQKGAGPDCVQQTDACRQPQPETEPAANFGFPLSV